MVVGDDDRQPVILGIADAGASAIPVSQVSRS